MPPIRVKRNADAGLRILSRQDEVLRAWPVLAASAIPKR